MSLLSRFEHLIALDPDLLPRDARFADLADVVGRADPAELAVLLEMILRQARMASTPWRPRTMQEWLT